MADPSEIGDDEILFRKLPVKFDRYDPDRKEVKPDAFRPTKSDERGISVDRAHSERHPDFRRIEEAAQGRQAEYYIAVLRAGDLRQHGFVLVPDPLSENPGHALIADLTYANRREPQSEEKRVQLAHGLVIRVEGPFATASN